METIIVYGDVHYGRQDTAKMAGGVPLAWPPKLTVANIPLTQLSSVRDSMADDLIH